jgi:hypothetical protein
MRDQLLGGFSAYDLELEKRQTEITGKLLPVKKRYAALWLGARELDPYFLGQPLPDLGRQAVMNSSRT